MCKYCRGAGCLYCPPPPEPVLPGQIARFDLNDPFDMELAKRTIGGEALKKAFGPGGGGADEILENCRKASFAQMLRQVINSPREEHE